MLAWHEFAIRLPSESWCERLRREHPLLAIEVVGIFPGARGRMVETVRVTGIGAARAVDALRAHAGVDVLHYGEEACTLRLANEACSACLAARAAGISPAFPLSVGDGGCRWRFQASVEQARAFARSLDRAREAFTLRRKRSLSCRSLLTPRQGEVLQRAVQEGYYARPRRVTLSQLADRLGIRKSTLSQSLATIEAKVLPRYQWSAAEQEEGGRGTFDGRGE